MQFLLLYNNIETFGDIYYKVFVIQNKLLNGYPLQNSGAGNKFTIFCSNQLLRLWPGLQVKLTSIGLPLRMMCSVTVSPTLPFRIT